MKNLPKEVLQQLQEAAKIPIGTFEFTYTTESNLFDPTVKGGIIFELAAGKHYFRLERNDSAEVLYYYSSPGTGTRVASVDLKKMKPSNKVFFAFTWSPEEINLYVGPKIEGGELVGAKGVSSDKIFRVAEDKSVIQVGDIGKNVMGLRIKQGEKIILESTAIEFWNETKEQIRILHTGESKEGYIFDTLISNLTFPLMVTGFEVYAKRRFSELEEEGVYPNFKKIATKMRPNKKYKNNQEMLKSINFQDFKNECRTAYFCGYGIKFRELEVKNEDLDKLERIFSYRGRVIHISSLLTMLNESLVPQQNPIFINNKTQASEYLQILDDFVQRLHKSTLELKRRN